MSNRILAIALVLILCVSCASLAMAADYPTAEGAEFTIFVKQQSVQPEYDEIFSFKRYEEMTGININWINTPADVVNEKISLTLAGTELPDAFMKCAIPATQLTSYGEAGDFLDLSELLPEYAPNFWAYAQANPDVLAAITSPDGAIYSLPAIADAPSTRINLKWFFNQAWLDNLGLKQPTTSDELYAVLKAFKEQDANGNGDPDDEVPMFTEMGNVYTSFGGMFGLYNRGAAHQTSWDRDPVTGELRFVPTSEAYREMMAFLNKLYTENLLYQESLTYSVGNMVALAEQDRLGVYVMTNLARLTSGTAEKFAPIEAAISGPNGDHLWAPCRSHLHSVGAFVITTECKNPELLLQWVDYFYTDEGIRFYHYGEEGVTCQKNEDGSYSFIGLVPELMAEGKSYDEASARINSNAGGNNPSMMAWPGFSGMELTEKPMAASAVLIENVPEMIWPILTYTADENEVVTTVGKDIETFVKSSAAKFVTGDIALTDDNWNAYVKQINDMGLAEFAEATSGAVERAEAIMQ